jgi:hypothetical protein
MSQDNLGRDRGTMRMQMTPTINALMARVLAIVLFQETSKI